MKGYSVDRRQRILAAGARGMPRREIVQPVGVRLGTMKRLLTKQRRGASLMPRTPPGRPAMIAPDQYTALRAQLAAHADATLAQHADLWNAAHGTTLRQWTVGRALRRRGWTRKTRA
jgi:transposase